MVPLVATAIAAGLPVFVTAVTVPLTSLKTPSLKVPSVLAVLSVPMKTISSVPPTCETATARGAKSTVSATMVGVPPAAGTVKRAPLSLPDAVAAPGSAT